MKPVSFREVTDVLAKNQPQYLPLPVHRSADGVVVSCWRLSFWERVKVLFTGRLWALQMTFGQPLQPQAFDVSKPFDPAPAATEAA